MADIGAGDEISKDYWPAAVMVNDATDQSNITSTTPVAGSPEAGVGFVSPKTGRVAVCVYAGLLQQDSGNRVSVTFEIYEGTSSSGTLVRSARSGFGVSTDGSATIFEQTTGNLTVVGGLTPGVDHYVRAMHFVDGGTTNDVTHRRIIVFPVP